MSEYKHVTHESIPLYVNEDSEILILGTLPSVKSREDRFYYAHKGNRFFHVLAAIYHEDEPLSINDRKAFLKRHQIALYDVIYECDIKDSSDSSIKNAVPIDLKGILDKYPSIKTIVVNSGTAKKYFDKYLLQYVQDIKVIYVSSTSGRNAHTSLDELIEQFSRML